MFSFLYYPLWALIAFLGIIAINHGDIFTFILFGRKIVACLGVDGNDFVLNSRIQDANAEEIYSPLTTPVFGSDVVYDCPNSKLMEQKKFVKFGLTQKALESHVQLIEREVLEYIQTVPSFSGSSGTVDVSKAMAEITIFTAARSLQGKCLDPLTPSPQTKFSLLHQSLRH
ncbi:Sterol 14-alpha demethylase [Fusarium sp. DS 682]|nr:Sterol 14-alpha demethylase [Fusarium sp. DS 682]